MKWYDRPEADKTRPNFKLHFKADQKPIKKNQPVTTTDSLGYHYNQANYVVDDVINRLTKQQAI